MFQETVEQKLHAKIIHAAAEKNRRRFACEHGGFIKRFARVFEHFQFFERPGKFRFAQIAAHGRVMQSADGNRRAILAAHDAVEGMHHLRLPVIHALKFRAVADGPVHRKRADAQHALQFIEQFQRIFHRPVALVHEREDRHAALTADLEKFSRLRLDAFRGINHHDDRVHGGEHAVGVLGKILVAGRVEQVDAVAVVVELQDRRADGDAALFFQLHPVGRGGALVLARGHGAGELHRAAVKQQLLR